MRLLQHIFLLLQLAFSLFFSEHQGHQYAVKSKAICILPAANSSIQGSSDGLVARSSPVFTTSKAKIRIKAGESTDFSIATIGYPIKVFFFSRPASVIADSLECANTSFHFSLRGPPDFV